MQVKDNTGNPDNRNLGWNLFDAEVGDVVRGGIVQLVNTGLEPLQISGVVLQDEENYAVKINNDMAMPGDSAEVEVWFTPQRVGTLRSNIIINANVDETIRIELFGTGLEVTQESSTSSQSSSSTSSSSSDSSQGSSSSSASPPPYWRIRT